MKALQLVLFTGLCLLTLNTLQAQVKIGDDELNIGSDRWLEIKREGISEFLLVTDSLYFGRSNSANTNTPGDALMLKLYGYGLTNFLPSTAGEQANTPLGNIFLAPSTNGEVLEVPMSLSLVISDSTQADLAITNGLDTFGTANLLLLDSIFATENQLRDSTNILRTLIANSENNDGDTITSNEYISSITVQGDTALVFIENDLEEMGTRNTQIVDLSPIIGANTFYLADGSLDEDRTVDGSTNSLTFTNIDSAEIEANFVTIDGDQVAIQQDGQDIIMINGAEEVKFRSTATDSILFIDDDGTLLASDYGTGSNNTGNHAYILGVEPDGTIVDVDIADILATQIDSTIYNNDGVLTEDRRLVGDNNNLTFTGVNAMVDSSVTSLSTTSGTNTVESTASDVLIGASSGDINLTTTDVLLNGTETVAITSPVTTLSDSLRLEGYGDTTYVGTLRTILGVDAEGNVIELTAEEILSSDLDSTIYNSDGTLDENRTLNGGTFDMTFTNLGTYTESSVTSVSTSTGDNSVISTGGDVVITGTTTVDVDGSDVNIGATDSTIVNTATLDMNASGEVTIDAGSTSTITSNGDNTIESSTGDVVITSPGAADINAPVTTLSDSLRLEGYGDTTYVGTLRTILGVDAEGNVIELTAEEILSSDLDSTIYNSDGTLDENRTLNGGTFDMTFTNLGTYTESSVTSVSTSTGDNSVISTGGDVVITGTTTVDVDGSDVNIGATDSTIVNTATLDMNASGEVTIDAGSTSTITSNGDNTIESSTGDVVITSPGAADINAPVTTLSDSLRLEGFGDTLYMGTLRTILGVDAEGNVIELTAEEILSSDTDSTIYTHDGTLTEDRVMTMDGMSLTFEGSTTDSSALISPDGKMILGGTTFTANSATSDVRLEVVGDILARRVHSSSDRRYKKNIKPIDSALEKVMHINGVTYDFRVDEFKSKNFSTDKQVGFIAQNLEEVIPEVVMTDGEGYKAVDYAKVTALLNEAIKEQQKLIVELQGQLVSAESKNENLSKEVADIKDMLKTLIDSQQKSSLSEE